MIKNFDTKKLGKVLLMCHIPPPPLCYNNKPAKNNVDLTIKVIFIYLWQNIRRFSICINAIFIAIFLGSFSIGLSFKLFGDEGSSPPTSSKRCDLYLTHALLYVLSYYIKWIGSLRSQ